MVDSSFIMKSVAEVALESEILPLGMVFLILLLMRRKESSFSTP